MGGLLQHAVSATHQPCYSMGINTLYVVDHPSHMYMALFFSSPNVLKVLSLPYNAGCLLSYYAQFTCSCHMTFMFQVGHLKLRVGIHLVMFLILKL